MIGSGGPAGSGATCLQPPDTAGPHTATAATSLVSTLGWTKDSRKGQVITLATQVNSIETQLRGMKHGKLETRVAALEEKVFASRG